MTSADDKQVDDLGRPIVAKLCLETPLYRTFEFERRSIRSIEFFDDTIDAYCQGCARDSVFVCIKNEWIQTFTSYNNHYFKLSFTCTRAQDSKLLFLFRAHKGILEKIGQYPSLADLANPALRKYRPVLSDESYRELIRGVGLASHDVGIGAFVYLRRVFENLIEKAAQKARAEPSWDEDNFKSARMNEKIQILSAQLPPFLVENHSLYVLLSAGVHKLSEQECMKAFPNVKLGIELILDDELEKHQREEKIAKAKREIAAATSAPIRGKT